MHCDATTVLSSLSSAADFSNVKLSVLWSDQRTSLTAGTTVVETVIFLIRTC